MAQPHPHGHDHAHHGPGHGHHHAPPSDDRVFALAVALNLGYAAIEAVFGLLTGSLGLVADAGHNLSDVLSLLLAWGATRLARRAPTARRTYGWRRATILAALANALLLLVAVGVIAAEAVQRLLAPAPIET
ncbi:MAG TPA: cation diffusion facilitator family transporter, partial [Acetobacteraceae bacterium]|nr:cation diffusion facilitator family transporter [Acetobacteraceae bacterium]